VLNCHRYRMYAKHVTILMSVKEKRRSREVPLPAWRLVSGEFRWWPESASPIFSANVISSKTSSITRHQRAYNQLRPLHAEP
jgi:hypothetical protein